MGFEYYFQKKVGFEKQDNKGIELLLREDGHFPASKLKQIERNTHQLNQFMEWQFSEISKLMQVTNCRISVNVSLNQLLSPEFFHYLNRIRPYYSRLTIEIIEAPCWFSQNILRFTTVDDLKKSLLRCIIQVNQCGISISLDDVGTGYNSIDTVLTYEKYIDELKVTLLPFRKKNVPLELEKQIVLMWVALAKSYNKKLVIEGIETIEEAQRYQMIECHQGFYYSNPEPIGRLIEK